MDLFHARRWFDWRAVGRHGAMPMRQRSAATLVFAVLVAIGFTLVGYPLGAPTQAALLDLWGWGRWFVTSLTISLCIGFLIQGMFQCAYRLIGASRMAAMSHLKRRWLHGSIAMLGAVGGVPLGLWLAPGVRSTAQGPGNAGSLVASLAIALLITGGFMTFFAIRHQHLDAERRAAEAQLKLLQGQIEPHFLFNTLANVVGLMDRDTPRAKLMLESFVDYLRSSLGSLRHEAHTLGDELALVEAYLKIAQIRMDDRLDYVIDVPDDLRSAALPALTLQPLVENAIQHGLEPKIEGGHVMVRARRDAKGLVVTVQDDGLGLQSTPYQPGSGTACSNIRERLRQIHGDAARLDIEAGTPNGVIASLTLP